MKVSRDSFDREGSVSKRNSCSTPSWASVREICRYSFYLKKLSCGGGFERATVKVGIYEQLDR